MNAPCDLRKSEKLVQDDYLWQPDTFRKSSPEIISDDEGKAHAASQRLKNSAVLAEKNEDDEHYHNELFGDVEEMPPGTEIIKVRSSVTAGFEFDDNDDDDDDVYVRGEEEENERKMKIENSEEKGFNETPVKASSMSIENNYYNKYHKVSKLPEDDEDLFLHTNSGLDLLKSNDISEKFEAANNSVSPRSDDSSIFESVSVVYEKKMKNAAMSENHFNANKNEFEFENDEYDVIDEKLVNELLNFTIGDDEELKSTNKPLKKNRSPGDRKNFAASYTPPKPLQSSRDSIKTPSKMDLLPSSSRLRESQKKLENIMNKYKNKHDLKFKSSYSLQPRTHKPLMPRPSSKTSIKNIQKDEFSANSNFDLRIENNLHRKQHSFPNSNRPKSTRPETPKPPFRAGSMTDFLRKIDEDGRSSVAGKNNPYWRRRPSSSHRGSYVDETLFGTNSDSGFESATWRAPWEEKQKSAKPYFCDWVWDRRQISEKI